MSEAPIALDGKRRVSVPIGALWAVLVVVVGAASWATALFLVSNQSTGAIGEMRDDIKTMSKTLTSIDKALEVSNATQDARLTSLESSHNALRERVRLLELQQGRSK